jgi:CelD/BcsL family acetyltransferase involved in cellulose biosynthesis
MEVVRFSSLEQLEPLAADWDRLARRVPFRSWTWLSHWWRHYGEPFGGRGQRASLYVLVVYDGGQPVGIAPWYCENCPCQGRVLRFLGLGEVCSEYLSVLCLPEMEERVAEALATWLTAAHRSDQPAWNPDDHWDLLELSGVDVQDAAVLRLTEELELRRNLVHRNAGWNCWRIDLPGSWEEFLAKLSKNHRKQLRRRQRTILDGRRHVLHCVQRIAELPRARDVLVDLHQRRRQSQGGRGCFTSRRFTAFHDDVMPEMLRAGQLRLAWLEVDRRPVVAEYLLTGNDVVYAYQSGMNPGALDLAPGSLGNLLMLHGAIDGGYRAFDFLRGDEPYKRHWRAEARPTWHVRVVPTQTSARLRHRLWLVGSNMKQWIKTGLPFLHR